MQIKKENRRTSRNEKQLQRKINKKKKHEMEK